MKVKVLYPRSKFEIVIFGFQILFGCRLIFNLETQKCFQGYIRTAEEEVVGEGKDCLVGVDSLYIHKSRVLLKSPVGKLQPEESLRATSWSS